MKRNWLARISLGSVVFVGALLGAGLGSASASAAPGVTKSLITVGLITTVTGAGSSTFADTAKGAEAAFAVQNAKGGVDGRKLRLVVGDDNSSPTGAATAAQVLVSQKHVFGVIGVGAFFFGAATYLHQQHIPVTGSDLDGPEWFTQPNTNMFNIEGTSSPTYPSYTVEGKFYKSLGAKKVSFVASTTPSSTRGIRQSIASSKAAGIGTCADATVPLGSVTITGVALAIKHAGCNVAECSCVLSTSLALSGALQNEGFHIPVVFDAGPAQQVITSATTKKEATGNYFLSTELSYSGPAYDNFRAALKKYDPTYTGGVPNLGLVVGWQGAGLFIKGLQVAGKNPTRASFMAKLRKVSSWNDTGLKPSPVSFTHFGQAPKTICYLYYKFKDGHYVPYPTSGKRFCGVLIPNSNAA